MSELLKTEDGRKLIQWACKFVDSPEVHHCRKWQPGETEAVNAVSDPYKIGILFAHEATRHGVRIETIDVFGTIKQARAMLAKLVGLPDNSRQEAEFIFQGK